MDCNSEKVIKLMQEFVQEKNMILTNARIEINIDMDRFRLNIAVELFALLANLCDVRNLSLTLNLHD